MPQRLQIILVILLGLAICLLVYLVQELRMERAVRDREAKVTQRYRKMIHAFADQLDLGEQVLVADGDLKRSLDALALAINDSLKKQRVDSTETSAQSPVSNPVPVHMNRQEGHRSPSLTGVNDAPVMTEAEPTSHVQENAAHVEKMSAVQIVALVDGEESNHRFITRFDGTDLQEIRLTQDAAPYRDPAWSPEGDRIAFAKLTETGAELWIMNADGGDLIQISESDSMISDPTWTPDGQSLAYVSDLRGNDAIYQVDLEGGEPRIIVPEGDSPRWSPRGDRLAFVKSVNIFIADKDGKNAEPILMEGENRIPLVSTLPRWSPDGTQIVFSALEDVDATGHPSRDNMLQLYTYNLQNRQVSRLTSTPIMKIAVGWTPDGKQILYIDEIGRMHFLSLSDRRSHRLEHAKVRWADLWLPKPKRIN